MDGYLSELGHIAATRSSAHGVVVIHSFRAHVACVFVDSNQAIYRFTRAVCFQDFSNQHLPVELQDSNPMNVVRTVNGTLTHGIIDSSDYTTL